MTLTIPALLEGPSITPAEYQRWVDTFTTRTDGLYYVVDYEGFEVETGPLRVEKYDLHMVILLGKVISTEYPRPSIYASVKIQGFLDTAHEVYKPLPVFPMDHEATQFFFKDIRKRCKHAVVKLSMAAGLKPTTHKREEF